MDPNDFTDEHMIFFINRIIQRAKVFRREDTKARR